MTRNGSLHFSTSVLAATAVVFLMHEPGAAGKPSSSSGTARFRDAPADTIRSDSNPQAYIGTFDRNGNFSFSTGTQRSVQFVFGAQLLLFGGQTPPSGASIPTPDPKVDVSFNVLGGSVLTIQPGLPQARSVRFQWPNSDDVGSASDYGLHFRGNALFDDDGDGVANEPFPQDGTEMSKMLTTCDLAQSGACVRWTMTPCVGDCGDANADPDPAGSTTPIGQLYGTFPKGTGNRPIARFEMPWGLVICRTTATNACP